ncbi:MAG: CheR family methyltransferase [Desulfosporosinus sp.]|nr:CheR family methyltransferase [Desulfosporosinus sp.]
MAEDYLDVADTKFAAALNQLGTLIAEKMGLHLSVNRWQDLKRTVQSLAKEHGQEDPELYILSLIASSLTDQQIKSLASHLTVGETFFFREMKTLEAFRDHVVRELIKQQSGRKRCLKVWSAGCSSGEEPYTVAMLIDQIIPKEWDIRIYGTDINLQALEKARRGVYTKWSFRGTSDTLRDRYFEPAEQGTYAVKARFKDRVSFSYLNLARDDYASILDTQEMDVIFCRNVMMYFTPQMIRRIIQRMNRYLVEGGWLIVAPSESSTLLASEFSAVQFEGATLYRKISQEPSGYQEWTPAIPMSAPSLHTPYTPFTPSIWPEAVQASPEVALAGDPAPERNYNPRRYEEALAAYRGGRYDEAVALLQTILPEKGCGEQRWEADGSVAALMAKVFANQGNLEQAIIWCDKAISVNKINPDYCFLQAMILLEQGQEKAAVQALKRSLYLNPDFIAAYYLLGTLAVREYRTNDANRYFQQALLLLINVPKEDILQELDGITAGRLKEVIQTALTEGAINS